MSNRNFPAITISVLTFNRWTMLRRVLMELSALRYTPLEIIVVDNHSEDQTAHALPQEFPGIRHMRTSENVGASARNLGLQAASGEIVVTLDDDITGLSDAALEHVASYFCANPGVGGLNFGVRTIEGEICNWIHHCRQEDYWDQEFLTYEITEGAVAFRKLAVDRSGGYPEAFFLSHEGPDLAFRLLEAGFTVKYSGAVSVTHHFAGEGRSPWRNYYFDTRNQLWLAARNFPVSYAFPYLSRGLLSMALYSLRDGYFRYWLKAIRDGLLGLRIAMRERKVLSRRTMAVVREIDATRPDLAYMVRTRWFSKRPIHMR